MTIFNKLIEQGLLAYSHNPALPWEINLPEFERLLTVHAEKVGVIEFRTNQRGYGVINPELPDETLKALLMDRIPDAQDVRITRFEDAA